MAGGAADGIAAGLSKVTRIIVLKRLTVALDERVVNNHTGRDADRLVEGASTGVGSLNATFTGRGSGTGVRLAGRGWREHTVARRDGVAEGR